MYKKVKQKIKDNENKYKQGVRGKKEKKRRVGGGGGSPKPDITEGSIMQPEF